MIKRIGATSHVQAKHLCGALTDVGNFSGGIIFVGAVSEANVKVLPPGYVGAVEDVTMRLLPVGSDDLFALLLFVCCYVFHGGMR